MTAPKFQKLLPLPENDGTLIPSAQLPLYIGIAAQTLARWRHEGNGPEFVKIGRLVAYRAGKVRSWLEANELASTAAR